VKPIPIAPRIRRIHFRMIARLAALLQLIAKSFMRKSNNQKDGIQVRSSPV
jgi:hypothetical protein